MLTEIALTPQVFESQNNLPPETWRRHLNEFGGRLRYYGDACPVVFANLRAGAWLKEIARRVMQIKDFNTRTTVETILTRVKELALERKCLAQGGFDASELAWVREAVRQPELPIHRVVASLMNFATISKELKEPSSLCRLGDLSEERFWENVDRVRSPTMTFKGQIEVLRPLLNHAEFLIILNPYAFSNEGEWVRQVVRAALDRSGPPPDIEVQTPCRDKVGNDDETRDWQNSPEVKWLERSFRNVLKPGEQVTLAIRSPLFEKQNLIHRRLFAGMLPQTDTGVKRSLRWAVDLGHVARLGAESDPVNTTFVLLGRREGQSQYDRLDIEGVRQGTFLTSRIVVTL